MARLVLVGWVLLAVLFAVDGDGDETLEVTSATAGVSSRLQQSAQQELSRVKEEIKHRPVLSNLLPDVIGYLFCSRARIIE